MDFCKSILVDPTPLHTNSDENLAENSTTTKVTKVTVSLLKLIEKTGYRLEQINGQRRYGGPPPIWEGPPPPKGSEIFVGKIPRDCFEDELVPVFETVGLIYELRLMMDFSGSNRGFAFVMYMSPEIAEFAVQKLNNYEIREGRRIGVVKSVNNCKLFIGGLPADKNEEDIKCVLCRLTEGVTEIWLYKNTACSGNKSRPTVQYAIVEYDSHRSAAMARRRLIPERVQLWGREIIVDWATPQNRTKPGDQDFCSELAGINEQRHSKKHSLPRHKGCRSGHSSSIWSLEQAMDNALYGTSNLESPKTFYIQENATNAWELVKAILPNVHNFSPSEIEAVASSIMKSYRSTTEEPSVTINQNVLKSVIGSRLQEISRINNERNSESCASHKLKQDFYGDNTLFKDTFDPEENIDPQQLLQEARLEQSRGLYRAPPEHLFLSRPNQTQMQLSDFMVKNETQQNPPMPVQERVALSELHYDQFNTFTNTGGCSKLKNNVRGMGQVPIEKMNNLQISGSKAVPVAYNLKADASPLSWLGKEASSFEEFIPPVMSNKNSLANDKKRTICGTWDTTHNVEDIFTSTNHVPARADMYMAPGSQNQNVNKVGFVPALLFNSDIEDMRVNSLFTSHAKEQSAFPSWSPEISKENGSTFLDNNNFPKVTDLSVDDDAENYPYSFSRAPGGPVRIGAKHIGQSKSAHSLSSPYKRLF